MLVSTAPVLITAGVSILLLIVVEGGTGLFLFVNDVMRARPPEIAETRHTIYDPELGWINAPNFNDPDLYGPGRRFQTENNGFRNATDVEPNADWWRSQMADLADSEGILFVDLVPVIRDLHPTALRAHFIQRDDVSFPGAAGHYTELGNRWVSEQLQRALREHAILPTH